jgi:hypothetical protein
MKKLANLVLVALFISLFAKAQDDKAQLGLDISKAYNANMDQLKDYIWKRTTQFYMNGAVVLTTTSDVSIGADGKINSKMTGATSPVKKDPGLRGDEQKKKEDEMAQYFADALQQSLPYIYLSKGSLVDFFDKATITKTDNTITAAADNVYMKGDHLELIVDKTTLQYKTQSFKTMMGKDPISGNMTYKQFSNGVNTVATMDMDLPAKTIKVGANNSDFAKKMQ